MRPIRELPALLTTPMGRLALAGAVVKRAQRPLLWLAGVRRRSLTKTRIVAVVGSYGKTTTSRAVAAALGLPVTPSGPHSAAGFVALHLLRLPRDREVGVFEAGINGPDQMRPIERALRPNVVVVTSIGLEHHRSFGSLEATRREKSEMLRGLDETGLAVLNGDDPNVVWMASQTKARVITFGFSDHCDVRASGEQIDLIQGTRCKVELEGRSHLLSLKLLGRHQIPAALAGIVVGREFGVEPEVVCRRLAELEPTRMRLQPVTLANGAVLIRDEFKSGIETIQRALEFLAATRDRRRIAVLGSITEPKRPQRQTYKAVGRQLAQSVDLAILLGSSGEDYAAGARQIPGGFEKMILVRSDWREALNALPEDLGPADVVLIKGRYTDRLERIVLALQGHEVGCMLHECMAKMTRCEGCPMLECGWGDRPVVV